MGRMNEQAPPFGTWILDHPQLLHTDLANALVKAAGHPDWPRFGDMWDVEHFINPNDHGAGVGGVQEAHELYRAEHPAA